MSVFFQRFRRDIVGIIWVSVSVFLALALVSFRATDPSFNSIGTGLEVRNYCGYFGSFLADILYQLWGIVAWLLVAASGRMAWSTFKNKPMTFTGARALWAGLLLVTLSSLLALYFPETKVFGNHVPLGGLIGVAVSKGLVAVFNRLGVSVILWSLSLVLLVFYTERSLRELLQSLQLGVRETGARLKMKTVWSVVQQLFAPPTAVAAGASGARIQGLSGIQTEERKARFPIFGAARTEKSAAQSSAEDAGGEGVRDTKLRGRAAQLLNWGSSSESNGNENDDEMDEDSEQESAPLATSTPENVPRRRVKMKAKIDRRVENWKLPDISVLEDPPASRTRVDEREILRKSEILVDKLAQFAVRGEVRGAKPGPAVTMYEFKPSADVKISKITELADDLSLALSSESVRIIAPIPGRDVVGIETSNSHRETVYLKDILAHEGFWSDKMKLPLALGRQADGETKVVDLRKMPHLLVAGTTGSGKSVFVVGAITGLLFRHSPKTLRLILVDPKQVDLAAFSQVPHLLMPPIREARKAVTALKWAIREMDKRYRSMSKFGARGIEQFNEICEKFTKEQLEQHEKANEAAENENRKPDQYYYTAQPYIVIVVEEFGDLMAVDKQNVESAVVRLAQMARACGIHLILAMQSPRKDVVTGLIKTNIPGRISFKVASKMDSRIILDDAGAERLLAQGDMLFLAPGVAKPQRHHGPWISEPEIAMVMEAWAEQGAPAFDPVAMKALEGTGGGFEFGGDAAGESGGDFADGGEGDESEYDEKYDEVLSWVSSQKEVSASLLQRRFRLGYPRAARMIELFEREGVVGPVNGSKPRQVLISSYSKEP
ncbi:MAG: DNA translocase FtsK [Bdellovibrionaceae bacterium]|nr:DNA translocase FtsK [Pseudobdellovibrionaceae bacterium]